MKHTNRTFYAVIGVIVLLFAGMVYAWSVISAPIAREFPAWTKAQLSLTFTLVMIFFCLGGMIGGFLSSRFRARVFLLTSAILFLVGFLWAARVQTLLELYVSFGVVCGLASGFAYNASMGTINRWFPDKQGLISGVLLMGFGVSSFLIGKIYQMLTPDAIGAWRVSFTVLGVLSAAVVGVCAFLMKKPDADFQPPAVVKEKKRYINPVAEDVPTLTMIRRPAFWMYYLWAILLSAGGLALVSQASGIAAEVGTAVEGGTIATVVGLISIFNGVGRVIFGALFDKLGRSAVMQSVNGLFIITAVVLFVALTTQSFPLIVAGFVLGGLSYGGVTPTNSAFVSSYYGMSHYPMNFSIINTNLIVASFGSTVAGALYDATQSYMSTYVMIGALAVVGIAVSLGISVCDKRMLREKPMSHNES